MRHVVGVEKGMNEISLYKTEKDILKHYQCLSMNNGTMGHLIFVFLYLFSLVGVLSVFCKF